MIKKKAKPKRPAWRPLTYTDEVIENLADKLLKWIKDDNNFYLGVFAAENGMWRERLQEFSHKNSYFACAYKQAKQWQENRFVVGMMTGKYVPSATIFTLKNVSGFRDEPAQTEDESIKDQELEFVGVPHKSNDPLPETISRFLN